MTYSLHDLLYDSKSNKLDLGQPENNFNESILLFTCKIALDSLVSDD